MRYGIIYEHGLTHREHEVFTLAQKGLPNKVIADKLCVGVATVKFHLTSVYKKLKVKCFKEMFTKYPGELKPLRHGSPELKKIRGEK